MGEVSETERGPAGLYDLYLVKYREFKYPQRVFRLNQRGVSNS